MVDNINSIPGSEDHRFKVAGVAASNASGDDDCLKEQDRLLPIANVGRIMKKILPPSGKISKEAKETMQECVSEFISFVTGEATDKCHKEKRKTVNGDDICWALGMLGFDDYAAALQRYLHRYKVLEGEKANQSKARKVEDRDSLSIFTSDQAMEQSLASTPLMFNVFEKTK